MKGAIEALFFCTTLILDRPCRTPNFVLISDGVNFIVVSMDVISKSHI